MIGVAFVVDYMMILFERKFWGERFYARGLCDERRRSAM